MSGKLLEAYRHGDDAPAALGPCVTIALEPPDFLAFAFANNNHQAFATQNLLSVRFDPSEGIMLHFTTHDVLVTGYRLLPLYQALIKQRVAQVREAAVEVDPHGWNATEEPPHVLTVSVKRSD